MKDPKIHLRLSSRAKHPHLKITPWGIVELIWPKSLDQRYIPKLSVKQKQWIHDRLDILGRNFEQDDSHELPSHIHFSSIRQKWHVQYQISQRQKIHQQDVEKTLVISGKQEHHGTLLVKWLKLYGKSQLLPWLDSISRQYDLPYSSARVANQKTRWGSCSKNKVISMNCKLLFLKEELVRYLLIHELCHTRHMNHSKEYWKLVESFEPDYRELDKNINQAHYQVPIWVYMY